MDKIYAVLVSVLALVLILSCELYLKLDRNRSLARTYLKKMDEGLDNWTANAERLFKLSFIRESDRAEFAALLSGFRQCERKNPEKKTAIVNQIRALSGRVIADNIDEPGASAVGREFTFSYIQFVNIRDEYNLCALRYNRGLAGKLTGLPGRILHMMPIPVMDELSIL